MLEWPSEYIYSLYDRLAMAPSAQGNRLMEMSVSGQPPHLLQSSFQATVPANLALPHHILPRASYGQSAGHAVPEYSHMPAHAALPRTEHLSAHTGRPPSHHFSPPRRRPSLQHPLERAPGSGVAQPSGGAFRPDVNVAEVPAPSLQCSTSMPPALHMPHAQTTVGPGEAPQLAESGSSAAAAQQAADPSHQPTTTWISHREAGADGTAWQATSEGGMAAAEDVQRGAARQSPSQKPAAWGPPLGSAPMPRGAQGTISLIRHWNGWS